jgi:hypothetical protein
MQESTVVIIKTIITWSNQLTQFDFNKNNNLGSLRYDRLLRFLQPGLLRPMRQTCDDSVWCRGSLVFVPFPLVPVAFLIVPDVISWGTKY